MKVVVQRVSEASVTVEGNICGKISNGLLLLVGIDEKDTAEDAIWLSHKILNLRIFSDIDQKMNLSVLDINGEILCISQFTLISDCKKGNRPSFINAAKPEKAISIFNYFKDLLKASGTKVETGVFGADMKVTLTNDGPVTIILDSQIKT